MKEQGLLNIDCNEIWPLAWPHLTFNHETMLKHVCHVLKFETLVLSEFSDKNNEHFLSRLSHLILGSTLQGGTIIIHISQRWKQRLHNLAKALLIAGGRVRMGTYSELHSYLLF